MRFVDKSRLRSVLRESVFSWSVGLAALLAVAVLAVSELAIEPMARAVPEPLAFWDGHSLLHFLQGLVIGALVIVVPLWLLVRRNAELRTAQRELTLTAEGARTAFYTWDLVAGRAKVWGKLRGSFAWPEGDGPVTPDNWIGLIHPEDVEIYRAAVRDHYNGKTAQLLADYRVRVGDGSYVWIRDKAAATRDHTGRVVALSGAMEEITELKETECALRESEARATLALLASDSRIWQWDIETGQTYRTRRCAEILGIPEDKVDGPAGWWLDQIHEDDLAGYKAAVRAHLKGETERFEAEYRVRRADGTFRWVLDRGLALRTDSGRAYRMAGATEDITPKKSTEDALRQTQATLRAFLDNAPFDMAVKDCEGRFLLFNRVASERFRVDETDIVGKRPEDFMPPELAGQMNDQFRKAIEAGGPIYDEIEHAMPNGGSVEMLHVRFPIRGEDGALFGVGAIAQDVTAARAAQREIVNQREQLRAMADALPASIVYITRDYRIAFINSTAERWWGMKREEVVGRPILEVRGRKMFENFSKIVDQVFEGQSMTIEIELDCADGKTRRIDRRYVPHCDADGGVLGVYGMSIDVTEQHAVAERLRQSQKMEAVGNLTGGIAHDFNNLMFAVAGNLEFLEEELAEGADGQCLRFVRNARKGVSRASDLTARLLAFSRRQTLRPENVDIVALFSDLKELLRRTLPENIEIHTQVTVDRCPVLIDAGQLESSLLNLAINARDAMPEGGDLTFRIERVTVDADDGSDPIGRAPGDYVRVQVVDTGRGMPPAVVEKVFEPFFTTKDVGQGTGLGLSMVQGFVEQSGGFVDIESAVDQGTSVGLFLPLGQKDKAELIEERDEAPGERVPQGAVLLVEDNAMVRDVAALYLADLGYEVTTAGDGAAALAHFESGARFDLVLSDVMMPNGPSGIALAQAARARDPNQPFLLMTGYADGNAPAAGGAAEDVPILQKPFTKAALARAVAAALDAAEAAPVRRAVSMA